MEKVTWEPEDTLQATYPFLFEDECAWSNIRHMHVFVCASMWEFRGRNSVKGEECKTREKSIFLKKKKGKTVISVESWKFCRFRMTNGLHG